VTSDATEVFDAAVATSDDGATAEPSRKGSSVGATMNLEVHEEDVEMGGRDLLCDAEAIEVVVASAPNEVEEAGLVGSAEKAEDADAFLAVEGMFVPCSLAPPR